MASTELPPLNFGEGGSLRLSLFAPTPLTITHLHAIEEASAETSSTETKLMEARGAETTSKDLKDEETTIKEIQSAGMNHDDVTIKSTDQPKQLNGQTEQQESNKLAGEPPHPPAQTIPVHPIPSLQDAFSESLDEATNGVPGNKLNLRDLDAQGRREALIAQDRAAQPFDAGWRFRPGQKQHELAKLIAQISFGVYLLLNGMANSNAQVVSILQGHIDEVDEFLEVALEDLSQASKDLNGRIDLLRLPLSNIQVFEKLLEDRSFRCEILESNEKIDHVVSRTTTSLQQLDGDIEAGLQATVAFTGWLNDEENSSWREEYPDVADIFDAMKGNVEGWLSAFDDMNEHVQEVTNLVARLSTIIAEMEKKAGEVSRKTWANIQPFSAPSYRSYHMGSTPSISIGSTTSSQKSYVRQSHRPQLSIQSLASTTNSVSIAEIEADHNSLLSGYPPVRSPPLSGGSEARGSSSSSQTSRSQGESPSEQEEMKQDQSNDTASAVGDSIYVLQPRTYTPQSPGPMPSPMLNPESALRISRSPTPQGNTSLRAGSNPAERDRNSTSTSSTGLDQLSRSNSIPTKPRSIGDLAAREPSPSFVTPRTNHLNPFESACASDSESITPTVTSRVGSEYSISAPLVVRQPRSDYQQHYHPVRASPHSPLQQIHPPSTASYIPSRTYSHNQTLSPVHSSMADNATIVSHDGNRSVISSSRTTGGTLKKKKSSSFGWFKKAFTMDDSERAAFQARKTMPYRDSYYEASHSPKFLDGRRLR